MAEKNERKAFGGFAVRVMIVHTVTYFVFGLVMYNVLHYERLFEMETIRDFMYGMDSPWSVIGPFLQPIRGLLFALALWPLRRFLLEHKWGWLILWSIFLVFGILSTPAAAPSSIEGVLYSKLPLWYHLIGLPEICLQTLVFSAVLLWWERQATKPSEAAAPKGKPLLTEAIKAIMAACFGYIGYAIGGLLSVAVAGVAVDIGAAGSDMKTQLMFVPAFVVNAIAVFAVARQWMAKKLSLIMVFLIFWAIDTVVPWLYQLVVTQPSPVFMALLLGFFPAVIIALSIRLTYKPAV